MAEDPQTPDPTAEAKTQPLPTVSPAGASPTSEPSVTGPARIGTPRDLATRARPGDVLVIDVLDLRQAEADALAATGAVAVVNAQRTASGRQPAAGARRLLDAGIAVIDGAGSAVLAVREGTALTLGGDRVMRGDDLVAEGIALTVARVQAADTAALDHLKVQVAVFGSHALERLEREGSLFFEGKGLPDLGVDVSGRVVLVVAAGDRAAADLKELRLFIRDRRPIVIAEGGAVDACLAQRIRPAVIVGGLEVAPDSALATARVIALPGDTATLTKLEAMGATHDAVDIALSGADLGTLAAHHAGAAIVVIAGRRASAVDVLSADPDVGIGSFLTALVTRRDATDASVIAATYRHRHSLAFVITVLLLAGATLAVALWTVDDVRSLAQSAWDSVSGWFGADA